MIIKNINFKIIIDYSLTEEIVEERNMFQVIIIYCKCNWSMSVESHNNVSFDGGR